MTTAAIISAIAALIGAIGGLIRILRRRRAPLDKTEKKIKPKKT